MVAVAVEVEEEVIEEVAEEEETIEDEEAGGMEEAAFVGEMAVEVDMMTGADGIGKRQTLSAENKKPSRGLGGFLFAARRYKT